jgi:hypothetical protein
VGIQKNALSTAAATLADDQAPQRVHPQFVGQGLDLGTDDGPNLILDSRRTVGSHQLADQLSHQFLLNVRHVMRERAWRINCTVFFKSSTLNNATGLWM